MNNPPQSERRFPTFRLVSGVLFSRRMLKWMVFGFACAATLLGALYAVENRRGAQAQEALRSQWSAEGTPIDPAAIIPPPVPDAENFAQTPFLAPMFDFVPGTQRARDTNGWHRAMNFAKEFPGVSTKGGWRVGAKSDLAEVYRTLVKPRTRGSASVADLQQVAATILEAVREYDPVLNELRAASAARPQSRFNIRYEEENPWGILLPHLAVIKRACQILWARASAELVLGQTDLAFDDVTLILFLADSIESEPLLISQLVRVAGFNIAMQVTWEGMAARQWSDSQLQTLQARLAQYDFLADLKRALESERVWANITIGLVRDKRISPEELSQGSEGETETDDLQVALALKVGPRGWFDLEQFNYNRIFDERLLPGFDRETRRVFGKVSDENARLLDRELSGRGLRSALSDHLVFAKLLLPALPNVLQKLGLAQTSADQATIACALERYRRLNGKYPDSLEALVPTFMTRLPHDLFSGQPLPYRRTDGDKFILYSVGWNEADDGGEVDRIKTSPKGVQDLTQGDWVWFSTPRD